jgi:predicted acetyltransferase
MRPEIRFDVRGMRPDEKDVFANLLQLYMYDFSEFAGGVAWQDGRFHYHDDLDERWGQPWFHAFLLEVIDKDPRDGVIATRPAGFAAVANASYFSESAEANQWVMDDFFVMRKYRRSGVGTMLARRMFEIFKGRWEVGEMQHNVAAQAFWRRVIGEYTGGRFEEVESAPNWEGPVQRFRNDGEQPRS